MSLKSFEKVIFENQDKGFQFKLTTSEFKGVEYLNLRKYFLSYEGEFVPSTEGATIPLSIENVYAIVDGLFELLSVEEAQDIINEYFTSRNPGLIKPAV